MKKSIICLIALICANVSVTIMAQNENSKLKVETVNNDDNTYKDCFSGGYGASECSIKAGADLGELGTSVGCSVTCVPVTYACCGIRCVCVIAQDL